jgi:hypothetical protein
MFRRKQMLLSTSNFRAGKSQAKYGNTKSYKGSSVYSKNQSPKLKDCRASPKFEVKVISRVQNKQLIQESKDYKIVKNTVRPKAEKYKGKKNDFLKNRKRSTKRAYKEDPNHWTASFDAEDVPPKSAIQKQADKEWLADIPEELTEQEKSHLLSISDQAERNAEYSSLISAKEESVGGNQNYLAGQPLRKSKVKNNLRRKLNLRSSDIKNFDELHFEKVNNLNGPTKKQKLESDDEDSIKEEETEKTQLCTSSRTLEMIASIRAKGQKAREERSMKEIVKRTPPKMECSKWHREDSFSKISPVPFPSLSPFNQNEHEEQDGARQRFI